MKINQLIVLKETRENEGRVALTPSTISSLAKRHLPPVMIESNAGLLAGFTDEEYRESGAHIFQLGTKPLPSDSFILRVKCPTLEREMLENSLFSSNTAMIGFLDPLDNDTTHIKRWKSHGLTLISLELLPLTANDPKNAQAAMSQFAGRLALHDAFNRYQGTLPKKVTVIGTGPAGMGAALTARELQLPVQLFGRQKHYRHQAKTAGMTYFILPSSNSPKFIREHLHDQTIIVTGARAIGKKSPLLIDEKTLDILPNHSILVDLSTGEGGNIVGSKKDAIVTVDRNISIVNISGYPKAEPRAASIAFSNCMEQLLLEIITRDREIDLENDILKEAVKSI